MTEFKFHLYFRSETRGVAHLGASLDRIIPRAVAPPEMRIRSCSLCEEEMSPKSGAVGT